MDSTRFDVIAREFSTTSTRRQALRTLGAAGLGLGIASIGLKGAEAAKSKKVGARCKKSQECQGGLQCKKANSQNSCYAKSEERCCKPVGAKCNDGCECCGIDVICNGGYCDKA